MPDRFHTARKVAVSLAAFIVPLAVFWSWYDRITPPLTGDEPHYLVIAASLAHDHTLDLRHAYADPNGVSRLAPGLSSTGQAIDFRHTGYLSPVHAPGLGVILAPVARHRIDLRHFRLVMVAIASLLVWQLAGWLRDLFADHRFARWMCWGATCFTLPFFAFTNQIYPEIPAALVLVVGTRLLMRWPGRLGVGIVVGALAALLPWFHIRFAVLGLALAAFALWSVARHRGGRRSILVAAPAALSLVALGVVFQHLYGSPWPWAPYSSTSTTSSHQGLLQTYVVGLGTWLSPTSGALPFGPFVIVGLLGLGVAVRRFGRVAQVMIAVALVYALVVVPFGGFGYSLPGRYAVVLLPFLCVAAVCVVVVFRMLIVPAVALALVSVGIVVTHAAPGSYGSVYDRGRVAALRDTAFLWPTTASAAGVDRFAFPPASTHGGVEVTPVVEVRPTRYHLELTVDMASLVTVEDTSHHILATASGDGPVTVDFRPSHTEVIDIRVVGPAHVGVVTGAIVGRPPSRTRAVVREAWKAVAWVVALVVGAVSLGRRTRSATPEPAPASIPT